MWEFGNMESTWNAEVDQVPAVFQCMAEAVRMRDNNSMSVGRFEEGNQPKNQPKTNPLVMLLIGISFGALASYLYFFKFA